jgi:hypothetical protein
MATVSSCSRRSAAGNLIDIAFHRTLVFLVA